MPANETIRQRTVTSNVRQQLLAAGQALSLDQLQTRLADANRLELRRAVSRLLDSREATLTADNSVKALLGNIKRRARLSKKKT